MGGSRPGCCIESFCVVATVHRTLGCVAQFLGVPFFGLLPKKLLVGIRVACHQRVLIDAGWKVPGLSL
nr:unnamed protein product [Digitaria exilis]